MNRYPAENEGWLLPLRDRMQVVTQRLIELGVEEALEVSDRLASQEVFEVAIGNVDRGDSDETKRSKYIAVIVDGFETQRITEAKHVEQEKLMSKLKAVEGDEEYEEAHDDAHEEGEKVDPDVALLQKDQLVNAIFALANLSDQQTIETDPEAAKRSRAARSIIKMLIQTQPMKSFLPVEHLADEIQFGIPAGPSGGAPLRLLPGGKSLG